MVRSRNFIIRTAGNPATAAEPAPYQWRRDGRTRAQALRAAGLGTARPSAVAELCAECGFPCDTTGHYVKCELAR